MIEGLDKVLGSTDRRQEHAAVKAWRQIRPDHSDPDSIESLKQERKKSAWRKLEQSELPTIEIVKRKDKSDVYRLRGPWSDGTAIIAKRCRAATAQVERMIYQEILPRVPMPALHCYGLVQEPESESCWLFLEEAAGGSYSPHVAEHRALAACWLAETHLTTLPADLQTRLPDRTLGHYLQLLHGHRATLLDHLAHNTALWVDDAALFRKLVTHCDVMESHWSQIEKICGVMPLTLVHGDFVIKNVRIRDGTAPALLVFDWELAGWGVPSADLAQCVGLVISPDLSVYYSVVKREYPHLHVSNIQRLAACGNLLRLIDTITWAMTMLEFDCPIFLPRPVASLQIYEIRLAQALGALGWS